MEVTTVDQRSCTVQLCSEDARRRRQVGNGTTDAATTAQLSWMERREAVAAPLLSREPRSRRAAPKPVNIPRYWTYQAHIRHTGVSGLLQTPLHNGGAVPAGTQGVLRRQHQDRDGLKDGRSAIPRTPGRDSEEWAEVVLAAEALEAHGFEGGCRDLSRPQPSCLASCRSS